MAKVKFEARITATFFEDTAGNIVTKAFENWYKICGKGDALATREEVLASKIFTGSKVWATFDEAKAFMNTGALKEQAQNKATQLGLDDINHSKIAFIEGGIYRI